MTGVKAIFIAMEIAMIVGLTLVLFKVDWVAAESDGSAILFKVLGLLLALNAVVMHNEQQKIEWFEEEEAD